MEVKAGIVVVNRFVTGGKKFKGYIDYIDRKEAVRNEHIKEYNAFMDYMGNPEKTTGIFTKEEDSLTKDQKRELKEKFKEAQKNQSLMWQTVISFDNRWLEENGLYDSKTGFVDNKQIYEITRKGISKMLENEGMLDSAIWSGAIHYNTDNIHIHIAITEPKPMREKMIYKGREEYRGNFKYSSLKGLKSVFVNEIIKEKEINTRINHLIRESIVRGKKEEKPLWQDKEFHRQFVGIYLNLPLNKKDWQYNNRNMKLLRASIDELSKQYIEKYHKEEMEELRKKLEGQQGQYEKAYGGESNYAQNKERELYARLGNVIINEMKEYDKMIKEAGSSRLGLKRSIETRNMGSQFHSAWKRASIELNKLLSDEKQRYLNQIEYERMRREIEWEQ